MNRDEWIYNFSHVYDPVIQEEVNIEKTSGFRSGGKFSCHSAAGMQDHHIDSPNEADCKSVHNNMSF